MHDKRMLATIDALKKEQSEAVNELSNSRAADDVLTFDIRQFKGGRTYLTSPVSMINARKAKRKAVFRGLRNWIKDRLRWHKART